MKKTTTKKNDEQTSFMDELLKNGTTVLTAPTREELAEMLDNIEADVRYMTGAVGRDRETGLFTLRIDKNE